MITYPYERILALENKILTLIIVMLHDPVLNVEPSCQFLV